MLISSYCATIVWLYQNATSLCMHFQITASTSLLKTMVLVPDVSTMEHHRAGV